ncbi:DHH family phosphoesterase [Candidatus Woesebacteria bacterium]|nr:DHH family phosphoesterase [Candidatus Woesebacteria bacterium]MCD8506737.1 DHH family phosphoesterase [Candidatus Woesebacteria bacterium]MCD8527645.1 DHH family phosphoesterase [Candidatus Woesebacteria bacterium]MCD8546385.1 DHH family phosphoesterase [Candidatus Woesebacteria bacterium]
MIDTSLAQQIWNEVERAQRILLHMHPTPDGDSAGSSLALRDVLDSMGKDVTLIQGDTAFPDYLRHLPGAENVEPHPYGSVETEQFDLFIILDSANKDQISRQSEVVFPENLRTLVIDHHATNEGYGDINWIDSGYVATCHMVFDLLTAAKIEISREAATCLFVGMFTDSGGFQYPPTSAATLHAAADLAAKAPDFSEYIFHINNTFDPENMYYRGIALKNIELFHNGHIAISAVSASELDSRGILPDQADKSFIANQLKSVVGWDVAVGLVESEPGVVKASFRTRKPEIYHVGKIAAMLGGGGHQAAAGLTLKTSLDDAKRQIVEAVLAWENEHGATE